MTLQLPHPYLLFLGNVTERGFAKTALGLADWAPERCVGEFAIVPDAVTTGLPALTPAQAHARAARGLVIGVANRGGVLDPAWTPALVQALKAGLDIVSGLHQRLAAVPELAAVAHAHGRRLIDIRTPPPTLPVATGRKRSGRRLLTVGTDCALGKKYTALALARALTVRGVAATFRATGQTGILIAGEGMPIDSVVADFIAGAAEMLSPDAAPDHWDVVEGQGSLFHPSYAGVSLGLLHGTQPDVVVVCHQPGRTHLLGMHDFPTPGLAETIDLTLALARRVNPAVRCGGIALNTAHLTPEAAAAVCGDTTDQLGLPAADPIRRGPAFEELVRSCLA